MKRLGVIGGLGPETTAKFYLEIILACQRRERSHRPGIVISSVPIPYVVEEEAIAHGRGVERLLPILEEEARRLERAGCELIVMPCNTLHIFIKELRQAVKVPVLSIVEETSRFLEKEGARRVGLIATAATHRSGIYPGLLAGRGITVVEPSAKLQTRVGRIVHSLVNGRHDAKDREALLAIVGALEADGVDCVLLACTDLQLLLPEHPTVKVHDTMRIFVGATVERMLG
jgi:aspartate racemase